jgi:hypothetical protein
MQGRSRMAALTLVVGTALTLAQRAEALDKVVVSQVGLELAIAGLGDSGCDVEVKPGHAGCKFRTVKQHVGRSGLAKLILKDVEATGTDHDCALTITIKEPGHPDKTIQRGLRLSPHEEGKPRVTPTLTCYVSSPSKIAQVEQEKVRR